MASFFFNFEIFILFCKSSTNISLSVGLLVVYFPCCKKPGAIKVNVGEDALLPHINNLDFQYRFL